MKENNIIKNALILCGITLVAGLLLGLTYVSTAPAIEIQSQIKLEKALNAVIENANYTEITVQGESQFITKIYEATSKENEEIKGYAIELGTNEGYGDTIRLMVGIYDDGTLSGIDIISHTETPGLGNKADESPFKEQFIQKEAVILTLTKGDKSGQNIDAISGATITSSAVVNAVNEAIDYYNSYLQEEKSWKK